MQDSKKTWKRSKFLKPGDAIRIIAPSGTCDEASVRKGIVKLRQRYEIRFSERIFARQGYFAGSDDARVRELEDALTEPDTAAILAVRGGYGATRIVEHINLDAIAAANKLLIGYSDITALHALWAQAGVVSVHGRMAENMGRCDDTDLSRWIRTVEGEQPLRVEGLTVLCEGEAEGKLLGGNLAVLVALAPTRFAPPIDDAIIFLEDVNEAPYRIDRMLTTLRQAGWWERAKGVALGTFTESKTGPDGVTIDDVLLEHFSHLNIPVVSGLDAGHIPNNRDLILGQNVTLKEHMILGHNAMK